MRSIVGYLKATVLGGALVVAPLVVGLVIVGAALRHTATVLRPIAKLIPAEQFAGVLVVDLLAVALLVLLSFIAGLVIATRPGRAISQQFDSLFLRHLPGFTLVKALTQGMTGLDAEPRMPPALIQFDDCWMLGFVIERQPNSLVVVFVPSAPTPAVGSLYFMAEERVRPLDASLFAAARSIVRYGVGSSALLGQAAQTGGGVQPENASSASNRPSTTSQ